MFFFIVFNLKQKYDSSENKKIPVTIISLELKYYIIVWVKRNVKH